MNKLQNFYKGKKVFISGGAGFIGSHLTDKLIKLGAITTVGDNLNNGTIRNVMRVWKNNDISFSHSKKWVKTNSKHKFIKVDFQNYSDALKAIDGNEIVFHLSANFGGRGYITNHPAACCEGFSINQNVIKASQKNGVDRILFASSACVYPPDLQDEYKSNYLLKEADAYKKNWAHADEPYGWAKLMGEKILESHLKEYGIKGVSTRYVTVYGPWEDDTHAITALIGRAVNREDPYIIWGSGNQDRDFTYVDDIVSGSLLACKKVIDGSAINLGTSKRYTIRETVELIFSILNWHPKRIIFDKTKPEGVKTRALNIRKAKSLGWKPETDLIKGLEKTIRWFLKKSNP